jgi:hypothetical protein
MLLQDIQDIRDGRLITFDELPETTFQGLKISIENKPGSVRKGIDQDGDKWKTKMFYPYGFIQKTEGADGDEIDCFIGPDKDSDKVFIIHSEIDGEFDEDKCMLGFSDKLHARDAFCAHYDQPAEHLGPITTMSIGDFKKALQKHKKGTRIGDSSGYTRVSSNELELVASALNNPKTEIFIDTGAIHGKVLIREIGKGNKHFDSNREAYDYLHERLREEVKLYKR